MIILWLVQFGQVTILFRLVTYQDTDPAQLPISEEGAPLLMIHCPIFILDSDFNQYLRVAFGENKIKNATGESISITNMNSEEMRSLAQIILAAPREAYNAGARTFAYAMSSRKISSKSSSPRIIPALRTTRRALVDEHNLVIDDISVMTPNGALDLKPFLLIQ